MTAGVREDYAKDGGVFRFDAAYGLAAETAKRASDHYLVYGMFAAGG